MSARQGNQSNTVAERGCDLPRLDCPSGKTGTVIAVKATEDGDFFQAVVEEMGRAGWSMTRDSAEIDR